MAIGESFFIGGFYFSTSANCPFFDTDLLILNGKVSLVSFENVLGVVIEDRAIANTLEAMHELIWNCLPAEVF